MLNQLHTVADIAADHRRTLLAEAAAERLARSAAPARPQRSGWPERLGPLRRLGRRAAGTPVSKIEVGGEPTNGTLVGT
ncbi:hypothetical protein FB558_2708 [Pseudonocardia kunmingensis]|uniref:Uncharacterized protein n=2 Tax=Pseudonocardia kunmingensis TaxID=630975 RepID=A0A543E2U2_9PSEU|nr:hypothetical protein FB558_2708 [Pseudonocardia kunmingensis]